MPAGVAPTRRNRIVPIGVHRPSSSSLQDQCEGLKNWQGMGNRLSERQQAILEVLPTWTNGMRARDAPSRRNVVSLLGLPETPSNQTGVSRATAQLMQRRMVWAISVAGMKHVGHVRVTEDQWVRLDVRLAAQRAAIWKRILTRLAAEHPR
jgi:hypothetical protein